MAVAVSGGGDSMALALLADRWAQAHGGDVLALIVDHCLRAESPAEAALAAARLAARGIASRILPLSGLSRGTALAERARAARYAALATACADAGIVHLLLGHHAADQAETVAMRLLAGSHAAGLAGMSALVETADLRLLRPLLAVAPDRLRAVLLAAGLAWTEDPSNADPAAQRARLRALRRDRAGSSPVTRAMVASAAARGETRAAVERDAARRLARGVRLHPEGFAVLDGTEPPGGLGGLFAALAGSDYPPDAAAVAAFAARPAAITLGGVRVMAAGRQGSAGDWLLLREAEAMQPPVTAADGAIWDRRFRLRTDEPAGAMFGSLGHDAVRLPRLARRDLPAAVLATLPAIRRDGVLAAVPHLAFPTEAACRPYRIVFAPRVPAASARFVATPPLRGV